MKKWIVLLVALLLCDLFFIKQRVAIKEMEVDENETYLDYEADKEKYTLTTGKITKVLPPRSERSIEEDHTIGNGGTYAWLCYIEFETDDGRTIKNRFFPYDTENDYPEKTVEVAYYVLPDIAKAVVATRTAYIPDTFSLRRNMIWIVVFSTASVATLVLMLVLKRKSY